MRKFALLIPVLLTACGQPSIPAPDCTALLEEQAIIDRCLGGSLHGNYIGDEECYPFSEERQYRGILVTGFEWQRFYPNQVSYEAIQDLEPVYWLEWTDDIAAPDSWFGWNVDTAAEDSSDDIEVDRAKCTHDCAFELQFVGKESLCAAGFGHLRQYPKQIIASRIVQARQLDLRPR